MSTESLAFPAPLRRAATIARDLRDRIVAVRPLYVLSAFVAVQWAGVAALAVTVRHNGWVYYMGGDQLWHYTGAYLIVHGKLAPTYVGIGWSTILAPIAAIAGPNLVSALPAIILFNTLVLLPLGLVCMYGIGERIAGRIFGYWAALLWIVTPFVGILYALRGYHQKWTELTLPQLHGLGAMSDYPSMIVLVVGAYLCLRAVDGGHWLWSAGAGFAVGYAIAIKPSDSIFLVAPALLFCFFRLRAVVPFALGAVPCLAALAFWKVRGQGNLPWRTTEPAHPIALGPGSGILHRYFQTNTWTQLHNNLLQLREHLWSDRVLEFLVVAGIVALIIRSRRAGIFVGAWFAIFLLLKGTYFNSSVQDASFWRLLMPAFPAFVLLVAAVPLLAPGIRARSAVPRSRHVPRRLGVAFAVGLVGLLAVFPIALVAATTPMRANPTAFDLQATLVPQSDAPHLQAQVVGGAARLAWYPSRPSPGAVFYAVYRSASTSGVLCGPVRHAPSLCTLYADRIGTTRATTFVDHPRAGTWTYRIGISSNWLNDERYGDVYVFSTPATITVRGG